MEKETMTTPKKSILLFEDDKKFGLLVETKIRQALNGHFNLLRFDGAQEKLSAKAYEDSIADILNAKEYANTILIISDRDLSKTDNYTGLSEAVISKVALRLGIPICLYARGVPDDLLERQKSWGDGRIVLDSADPAIMASKVLNLANGFEQLHKKLALVMKRKGKNKPESPASVMAHILGNPSLSDKISMYGSGDQKMISEILPYAKKEELVTLEKRLPCILGYWLYDSILRFPGLLVDSIAGASYLNIDEKIFSKDKKIRGVFDAALYDGPFSNLEDPLWWRWKLDDIVQAEGVSDGRSLLKKRLKSDVGGCSCSLDKTIPAGYYCVATRKPVSAKNSHGNISWFPPGADLSRVRNDIFDEVGPWLGLF